MSAATGPSDRPVYTISVAADLAGVPIPTLRLYEERGLVRPERTAGGTRRYSDADLARIARVSELAESGIPLTAVALVLELQDDNADLATRNRRLRARNSDLLRDNERLRGDGETPAQDT